ncbi:hypothetical protein SCOR_04995 [Sulfidibacter corallicola]
MLNQSKRPRMDQNRSSRDLEARLFRFALLPLDLAKRGSLRCVGPAAQPTRHDESLCIRALRTTLFQESPAQTRRVPNSISRKKQREASGPWALGRHVEAIHPGSSRIPRAASCPVSWPAGPTHRSDQVSKKTTVKADSAVTNQSKRPRMVQNRSSRDLEARLIRFALLPLDLAKRGSLRCVGRAGQPTAVTTLKACGNSSQGSLRQVQPAGLPPLLNLPGPECKRISAISSQVPAHPRVLNNLLTPES